MVFQLSRKIDKKQLYERERFSEAYCLLLEVLRRKQIKMEMSNKTKVIIAFVAAFFVLLSAMLAPPISAGLAICFLVILAVYKLYKSRKNRD
jgi:uncharacterized membrane protein